MAVTSSQWRYDYPGSLAHSVRPTIYLNIGVSVTNHGSVPLVILAAEFTIFWQNETVGIPAMAATLSTSTIQSGQTGSATVAFLATELTKPVRIEFRQAGFVNTISANVPTPVPLPFELMITGLGSNWSANGTGNETASSGNTFLWVNGSFMNHQTDAVTVMASSFKIVDENGSSVSADAVVGTASLASFTPTALSILFEVPEGFAVASLKVDIILGPWTDVEVPPPA